MRTIGDNYAFQSVEECGDLRVVEGGLTKREYFSAAALTGLCSVPLKDFEYTNSIEQVAVETADTLIDFLNRRANETKESSMDTVNKESWINIYSNEDIPILRWGSEKEAKGNSGSDLYIKTIKITWEE